MKNKTNRNGVRIELTKSETNPQPFVHIGTKGNTLCNTEGYERTQSCFKSIKSIAKATADVMSGKKPVIDQNGHKWFWDAALGTKGKFVNQTTGKTA